jgi:uncharacterized protein involved in exopolysaccharide biosynthesis
MEQQELDLTKIKGIIKRRKWWLVLPFLGVFSMVTAIALVLPDIYQSTATIMIQNPQIPKDVVPTAVSVYADQRIQSITQEVTSRSKILALVEKYDLIPDKRDRLNADEIVEKVRDRIKVETISAEIKNETLRTPVQLTIAFQLAMEDESAKKAQMVANEIASYFMSKNIEERGKRVRSTTEFLEDQLRQAKENVDSLETKLAAYREKHLEELPEFTNLNMQKLEKLNADISNINMQVRSLEEQRATTKSNMAAIDPFSWSGSRVMSNEERLQQAQMERAALVSKYSEKHPLVQAKNQEIDLLDANTHGISKLAEARAKLQDLETKLAGLKSRYTDKHPAVVAKVQEVESARKELEALQRKVGKPNAAPSETPTNPAFVSLKADLERIGASISSLNAEKARLELQIKEVYEKLHSMPQVTKEYNELTTDYQNAKAHYTDLQQKLMAAQVAQGMEEGQLGESFQIVEPPFLPEEPAKPNRLAIILIGFVLGAGFSLGLTSLREFTDYRIRDLRTVEQLTMAPILSVIPRIVTGDDVSKDRRRKVLVAIGTVGGIVVALLVFHFMIMDLYVFYAKLERFIYKRMPI